jgi:hypothetical protein
MSRICLFAVLLFHGYCIWKYEVPISSLPVSVQSALILSMLVITLIFIHDCYLDVRNSKQGRDDK